MGALKQLLWFQMAFLLHEEVFSAQTDGCSAVPSSGFPCEKNEALVSVSTDVDGRGIACVRPSLTPMSSETVHTGCGKGYRLINLSEVLMYNQHLRCSNLPGSPYWIDLYKSGKNELRSVTSNEVQRDVFGKCGINSIVTYNPQTNTLECLRSDDITKSEFETEKGTGLCIGKTIRAGIWSNWTPFGDCTALQNCGLKLRRIRSRTCSGNIEDGVMCISSPSAIMRKVGGIQMEFEYDSSSCPEPDQCAVMIMGGHMQNKIRSGVEAFWWGHSCDSKIQVCQRYPSRNPSRPTSTVAFINRAAYFCQSDGGCWTFDKHSKTWRDIPNTERYIHSNYPTTAFKEKIYFMHDKAPKIFNPLTNTWNDWSLPPEAPEPGGCLVAGTNEKFYLFVTQSSGHVLEYDPYSNMWNPDPVAKLTTFQPFGSCTFYPYDTDKIVVSQSFANTGSSAILFDVNSKTFSQLESPFDFHEAQFVALAPDLLLALWGGKPFGRKYSPTSPNEQYWPLIDGESAYYKFPRQYAISLPVPVWYLQGTEMLAKCAARPNALVNVYKEGGGGRPVTFFNWRLIFG